jgi:putative two-component system response regulator
VSSSDLKRIETLLLSGATTHEPEFKIALKHLSAEIKNRLKKGSPTSVEFFSGAVHALARMKGVAHAEIRLNCLFDSGLFLFSNGFGTEALLAARELNNLATRTKQKLWIRKAGNLSGIVNSDLGNVADAVICYSKSLSLAKEIGDEYGEVSVLINLGVALNYGGLYREAIPCFIRAADLARIDRVIVACRKCEISSAEFERAALTNIAQSHLYLEEFHQGFAAISECLAKSEEPLDAMSATNRAIREFTCVQLALELGDLDLAREHSDKCAKYGGLGGNRGVHVSKISRGLCEVYGGNSALGLRILESLLSSTYDVNSAQISTLAALVKAYDLVGRPERALEHMTRLLEQTKSARGKGILALLSLSQTGKAAAPVFVSESEDLRVLKYTEAQLRAKVAENDAFNSRVEMLERLAVTADLKEESSGEHGYRVGKLSSLLAEELNWNHDACFAIELAARLHDIGKIGVPDRILLNSQELKEAERHFMSTHTVIGAELLAKSNIPQLRMAEEIARYHHEWWNGAGYPSKLAGKRIPIHARIVALADVFDALTHGRPFAEPWPMDRALEEIRTRRGTQFDPDLTDRFLNLVEALRAKHSDLDAYLGKAGRNSPFLQARNKIRLMLAEEREQERKATVSGNETRH